MRSHASERRPDAADNLCSQRPLSELVLRTLRSQQNEIRAEIYHHICAVVADQPPNDSREYHARWTATIGTLVEYCLEIIERTDEHLPIPPQVLAHARYAACVGVRLGVILRRYQAGYHKLIHILAKEAERLSYPPEDVLQQLMQTLDPVIDRVTAVVENEYVREQNRLTTSSEQRRVEIVQKLLAEESVSAADIADLHYDLEFAWHLGVVATGPGAAEVLRCLQAHLLCASLLVPDHNGVLWAWLGRQAEPSNAELRRALSRSRHGNASLAIGEPGGGLDGWRQTHREAQMAFAVARHQPRGQIRCADVLPEVSALQNDAIVKTYEKTYLLPLNSLAKGGRPARESLRAYFRYGRSASCAGDAIRKSRRTIENHLKDVRELLGDPLNLAALEIALRLEELGYTDSD